MSPKEKAQELYDKYKFLLTNDYKSKQDVKESALITIEEIQKNEYNVLFELYMVNEDYKSNYWEEVKQELIKL